MIAKSLKLQRELMKSLPQNARGLTMTVIDACRTDVVNSLTERGDGLNQVEAPVGGLIVFSAQAGRPAIAPDSPDRNTFFTECLVQNLLKADEWMTFPELFQWVKLEVNDVMSNHPLPIVRKLAQDPFIADNSRLPLTLSGAVLNGASPLRSLHRLEVDAFEQLHALTWPTDVVAQARQFVVRFPKSPLVNKVRLMDKGAQQALTVLKRPDVRLFRSAFEVPAHWAESEPQYRVMAHEDLCRAARGDKDAALRLGRVYQQSWTVVPDEEPRAKLQYRQEAWMRYATALGNGIAAYELGLHFRAMGQPALAAEYESRALDLGFETPQGLTHSRK